MRGVVGHRVCECPCAWAAGETSHISEAVPGGVNYSLTGLKLFLSR